MRAGDTCTSASQEGAPQEDLRTLRAELKAMEARLGSAENDVANHDRRLEELVEDFEHATSHEESTKHREPVAEQVALLRTAADEPMKRSARRQRRWGLRGCGPPLKRKRLGWSRRAEPWQPDLARRRMCGPCLARGAVRERFRHLAAWGWSDSEDPLRWRLESIRRHRADRTRMHSPATGSSLSLDKGFAVLRLRRAANVRTRGWVGLTKPSRS